MAEEVIVPRSFKLLDELHRAEGKGDSLPHAGVISWGLADNTDMTLTHWQSTIFPPQDTPIADRIYRVLIECGENYPEQPPQLRFQTRFNADCVDQSTGRVDPRKLRTLHQWTRNDTMDKPLVELREIMQSVAHLPQPEGNYF
ncbi:MAG: hypothetical protein MHM6MM_004313 [Cercozoa sp. M6MM]